MCNIHFYGRFTNGKKGRNCHYIVPHIFNSDGSLLGNNQRIHLTTELITDSSPIDTIADDVSVQPPDRGRRFRGLPPGRGILPQCIGTNRLLPRCLTRAGSLH